MRLAWGIVATESSESSSYACWDEGKPSKYVCAGVLLPDDDGVDEYEFALLLLRGDEAPELLGEANVFVGESEGEM